MAMVSEDRMAALEARTARLEMRLTRLDAGAAPPHPAERLAPRPAPPRPAAPRPAAAAPAPVADPRRRAGTPAIEDLVGGRVLGWVGALAVLVGLLFLLVIAASRGWIGEEVRVLMAAVASLALLAGGAWLHERRGRTEAA